jgi:ABC-type cobalamin/Fe3+-siderophores transport system ATPase subunit
MARHGHIEFIKLTTRTNVSCLDLGIQKSKEVIVLTHESEMGITYCSMVLIINEGMAC